MLQRSVSKKSSSSCGQRCEICYKDYDLTTNKPLLVCHSNHSLCKACLLAIRDKPLCPFCRQLIAFNRIRLHSSVFTRVANKLSRTNVATQRLGVPGAAGEQIMSPGRQIEQLGDILLEESQFIDSNRLEQAGSRELTECSMFMILLYIYFVVLQLPLGGLNIYAGCSLQHNHCRYETLRETFEELRLSYKILGGAQIMLSLHFLYLRYLFKTGRIGELGQLLFNLILSLFVILKSILSIILFVKFLHEKSLSLCLSRAGHHLVISLFVNYLAILIGINVLLRLCCLLQIHH